MTNFIRHTFIFLRTLYASFASVAKPPPGLTDSIPMVELLHQEPQNVATAIECFNMHCDIKTEHTYMLPIYNPSATTHNCLNIERFTADELPRPGLNCWKLSTHPSHRIRHDDQIIIQFYGRVKLHHISTQHPDLVEFLGYSMATRVPVVQLFIPLKWTHYQTLSSRFIDFVTSRYH
jgi:hypothetical protein